jgi:hypothetical protein
VVHALLFALAVTALFAVVYWSTASSIAENLDREIEAELNALVGEASDEGLQGVSETIARRMEGAAASGDYLLLRQGGASPQGHQFGDREDRPQRPVAPTAVPRRRRRRV